MNCFIYVIGVTDNPVKIGRAVSVERRLTALQIGNQDPLTVFARVPLPMGGSALVERKTHDMLREHHRRGEWFNVTSAEAVKAIHKAAALANAYNDNSRWNEKAIKNFLGKDGLSQWAPYALQHYHASLNTLRGYMDTREMDQVIISRAGRDAHIAFLAVFEPSPSFSNAFLYDRRGRKRAVDAARRGLNALSEWYGEAQEQKLLDEIYGNAA